MKSGEKTMSDKKNVFEESLAKLEAASENLKRDDLSLDEAIRSFEDGQKYYKECVAYLDEAKQKIETYVKQED